MDIINGRKVIISMDPPTMQELMLFQQAADHTDIFVLMDLVASRTNLPRSEILKVPVEHGVELFKEVMERGSFIYWYLHFQDVMNSTISHYKSMNQPNIKEEK